jgi:regulator of RNase E activity RraB
MEQELKHPDYRDKKLSSIDILVYVLGFVIYNYTKENGLEIMYPKEIEFIKIFGKKLTDNQIEKILKLVSENNDSYDAMCDAFSDSNKRSNMAMMKKVI